MREDVTQLSQMMSENAREQQELFTKAKGFEEIIATLQAKRQEARTMETYIDELSVHLTHLEESDSELQHMQKEYGERMKTYHDHINAKKLAHVQAGKELDRARDRLSAKLKEEGRIQAEHTVRLSNMDRILDLLFHITESNVVGIRRPTPRTRDFDQRNWSPSWHPGIR